MNNEQSLSLWQIEEGLQAAVVRWEEAREQMELAATEARDVQDAASAMLQQAEGVLKTYLAEEVRKVNGIAGYIRHREMIAEACDTEAERVKELGNRSRRVVASVKAMVLRIMQEFGESKFETPLSSLRRQKNGGTVAPIITDPAKVPAGFVGLTVSMTAETFKAVDQQLQLCMVVKSRDFMMNPIRCALERGEEVPGCKLGERQEHLRVS